MKIDQRNYAFDTLKFILALCVFALHYNWKIIPRGYLAVECFFILSGYLFHNLGKMGLKSPIEIAKKFYLPYILSIIIVIAMESCRFDFFSITRAVFMLQCLGFSNVIINGPTWFLCVYVFGVPLIFLALSLTNRLGLHIAILCVLTPLFLYYAIYTNAPDTGLNFFCHFKVFGITAGLLRCFSAVCVGILTSILKSKVKGFKIGNDLLCGSITSTLVVIFAFSGNTPTYDYISVLLMAVFIFALDDRRTLTFKVFDTVGRKAKHLGKASLYIFLFHYPFILAVNNIKNGKYARVCASIALLTILTLISHKIKKEKVIKKKRSAP